MKRIKGTKIFSMLLAVLLCVCAVFANTTVGKAAEYQVLLKKSGTAMANQEVKYDFTLDINKNAYLAFAVPAPVKCEVSVYNSAGKLYKNAVTISESDWQVSDNVYAFAFSSVNMPAGDYSLGIKFDEDTQYVAIIQADKQIATISTKAATVTSGFTKKLKVNNTSGKVTWSSGKKSVATVNSKGIVTAKKPGTATITAKTKEGQKLTCKITVKENVFKQTKFSTSDVYYGKCGAQVYNASYNSNGDLVLKCKFLNNSGYWVNSFKNAKITFKTNTGKTIGTYSASTIKMNIAHASSKDFTVKIKKSNLKIKKADLRNATYKASGKYEYRYYN